MPTVKALTIGCSNYETGYLILFDSNEPIMGGNRFTSLLEANILKKPNCSGSLGSCHHLVFTRLRYSALRRSNQPITDIKGGTYCLWIGPFSKRTRQQRYKAIGTSGKMKAFLEIHKCAIMCPMHSSSYRASVCSIDACFMISLTLPSACISPTLRPTLNIICHLVITMRCVDASPQPLNAL